MLDFKTLIVVNFIVNVISLLTMAVLWARYGKRFEGLAYWLGHMAAHVAGIGLILLRGDVPGAVTAVGANALLMASTLLLLMGFERFTGRITRQWPNHLAFAAFVAALCFFHAAHDSYVLRTVAGSLLIVFVDAQTCRLLLWGVSPAMRRITLIPGLVVGGYVAVALARILVLAAFPRDTELFRSGLADSLAITSYLALHICLMVSLALMLTRRLLDEVASQEEKFATAFHSAPYALVIARAGDGRVVEVNKGFRDIFGFTREEALARPLAELNILPPDAAGAPSGPGRQEIRVSRRSGEPLVGQLSREELTINGEACVLLSIQDVTEESRLKRQLQELATRDSLTGLPNRRLFGERFEIARQDARRRGTRMAVLSMDLDRFKSVNDSLGHAAGDAVLVEAARRLTETLRKVDVVARFGGDEFVILLPEVRDLEDAGQVAGKLVERLREPFAFQGRGVPLSASIGVSVYPDSGQELEELLKQSDMALYRAKHAGRDGHATA